MSDKQFEDMGFKSKEIKGLKKLIANIKDVKSVDGSTTLSLEEFNKFFSTVFPEYKQEGGLSIDNIFLNVDKDCDGSVNVKEVLAWIAIYIKGDEQTKLLNLFDAFDLDENGVLEGDEINKLLDLLKIAIQDSQKDKNEIDAVKEASALLQKLDADKNGAVTKEEWCTVGKQVGLTKALLGAEFLKVMDSYKLPDGKCIIS
eukprot:TRINITY_DN4993_c1_g1_i1.p1 TRINITY_DN4993_c1_g1~~TRINITY_DN4993_c1_g1_i1.p1  ORF type:complete len:201 (-),score=51.03 TRINITY_DN4993_c1_g1_i1:50-652(-)